MEAILNSKAYPDKKLLERALELVLLLDTTDIDGLYETTFKLSGLLTKVDPEKGIQSWEKFLNLLTETKKKYGFRPTHCTRVERIKILSKLTQAQTEYGNIDRANMASITAWALLNELKLVRPEAYEDYNQAFKAISKSIVPINLKNAIVMALSLNDRKQKIKCIKKVIQAYCNQIKKKIEISLSRNDGVDLNLIIPMFYVQLNLINDPLSKCKLLLEINEAIRFPKECKEYTWFYWKNNTFELIYQIAQLIEDDFERCCTLLALAKQCEHYNPTVENILNFAIELSSKLKIEQYEENSKLLFLITHLQIKFNIQGLNSDETLLKIINQIDDLDKKMKEILKLAAISKKQEIFDLAIATAIKMKNLNKIEEMLIIRYLAEIASLDLKQTPFILDQIKEIDSRWEIPFLDQIKFNA
ncbi:MAG: hypothetical protein H0V82_09650 [Candidatus Protochlamydia sp.]|nr:hypothetical protein [Candidatus Protochlamydia sp.]